MSKALPRQVALVRPRQAAATTQVMLDQVASRAHLLVVFALVEVGLADRGAVHLRQAVARLAVACVAPVALHLAGARCGRVEHLHSAEQY